MHRSKTRCRHTRVGVEQIDPIRHHTRQRHRCCSANSLYGACGGPISGVWTGFAKPKKTTVPLPPKRVDSAGSGTFLKPSSGRSQLFATHTLPREPDLFRDC
jgi:hypothetical protein